MKCILTPVYRCTNCKQVYSKEETVECTCKNPAYAEVIIQGKYFFIIQDKHYPPITIKDVQECNKKSFEEYFNKVNEELDKQRDTVNHPPHYTQHPSGIECIQITRYMNFNLGNVIKYIWRAESKGGLEDLKKARWYLDNEIERLTFP